MNQKKFVSIRYCVLVESLIICLTIYVGTDGGARGVIVIVVGNEHGDTSSNPGRD